ncbi:threonyl-tRNA synthetase editing domain-containing protein [Gaoshiqia sediminis]|uniref:Threonyl-tRNA synthetase editing domain-containing protein n=1 Tax=Gaoshiqia sediminis TaxID=2986998 RepID=A0AA41YA00_9BACT|nr:threonyl-tRNA synthetase editing domain-containing protein [Gaoshiqia sediminis]MCW0484710.1 threonyl-tRNA synthetase editing domain-containing protein [Gaoshiqia sediminis]
MKVLVMYIKEFSYQPATKNLDLAEEVTGGAKFEEAILAFIQAEEKDEEKEVGSREKKLVNHLKWTARKNNTKRVILHSFAHLSDSKASVQFTQSLFDLAEQRLQNAGFETAQTPFGYFLDLKIDAPGFSLARIWADL